MGVRQKRVALINDITGFGRCSMTVEHPIISALKIQACPLPTAILSVHTGFKEHFIDDYTPKMRAYMDNWRVNNVTFDGICTGFFGSAEQIDIVIDFIKMFRKAGTKVMVDPVLGDHGRLYSSITKDICHGMRRLLSYADLLTPNLTEACELLGLPYPHKGQLDEVAIRDMAGSLAAEGPSQVVITGLDGDADGKTVQNFIYEQGKEATVLSMPRIGGDRSGTGDVFVAIVAGSLINGEPLTAAVRKAAGFISKVLAYTEELDLPWNWGLPFEEFLVDLQ